MLHLIHFKSNCIIRGNFYLNLRIKLAGWALFLGIVNFIDVPVHAQSFRAKENNIWLGTPCVSCPSIRGMTGAGLNFNADTMVTIWGVAPRGLKGDEPTGAAICDKNGRLLFYTNGNIVFDRNNDIMPNGWDINNTGQLPPDSMFMFPDGEACDNVDGVVIMPVPGNSHKYYIFSSPMIFGQIYLPPPFNQNIKHYKAFWHGKLFCTVVDMELNNGLGGVDPDHHGIVIADSMAGNLQGIVGDNCDAWLLGFGAEGVYKAFRITSSGIDANPVISNISASSSPYVRELNVSPNRHKAAMVFTDVYVEVTDFDPATGKFSNPVSLAGQGCNAVAFSPNDSFFYLSGVTGIRQYHTYSLTTPVTMLTINKDSTYYAFCGPLKLAPDGKIYFTYNARRTINGSGVSAYYPACIKYPNRAGIACQVDTIGPPSIAGDLLNQPYPMLARAPNEYEQLPNESPILLYDTVYSSKEVSLCFSKPALLEPKGKPGTDYHWMVHTVYDAPGLYNRMGNDTTSTTLTATVPGTYAVQYYTSEPCLVHRDTFIVKKVNFSLYLGKDTISCEGESVELDANVPDAEYLWQDSSTGEHYLADHSGGYWVQIAKEGCTARDTIGVTIIDIRQHLGNDTTVCIEEDLHPLILEANVPPGSSVQWSTGSTSPSIPVSDSGWYWVQVSNGNCLGTDSIFIDQQYCDCPILLPTAFSPNNDGKNDEYKPALSGNCPVNDYKLEIYNRWGQLIFVSYDIEQGWDGTYKGQPADVGTYAYHLMMITGLRQNSMDKSGDFVLIR